MNKISIHCACAQRRLIKVLLMTKLVLCFITAGLLQANARTMAQHISLSAKQADLKTLFTAIRQQSGFHFVYTQDMLKSSKPVSIEVKDADLETVLTKIFENQPLMYSVEEKTVIVKEKEKSILSVMLGVGRGKGVETQDVASQQPLTGRVIDTLGQPIAGATVTARFTRPDGTDAVLRVSTNGNGLFTLRDVPTSATLSVSSVGYLPLEISASSNLTALQLKPSTSPLDEVQIIAYGSTTKRFQTGNVTTVTSAEIERQPINNPLLALVGRVPGMFITQNNGLSGSGVKVAIQGQNSLGNGNDPFYVIDGVPYTSQLLPNLGNILGGSRTTIVGGVPPGSNGNPMSFINPSDIESIEVLKDADATAIYGSRAANGAILITTKKGKTGKTEVNLNVQQGWGKVTRMLDLMNTLQYLEMRHEALRNDGIAAPSSTDYDLNGTWDTTRYTDWQKELIGGTAHYTDAQASVSGGNANTQFLIGTGYHRETTVFPGDFADQKGSLHFNINHASTNQKFKVQLSGSYLTDNNKLPNQDLTDRAIKLAPVAPALYNPDGTLNWAQDASGRSTWTNPLYYTLEQYKNTTTNLISNLRISHEIVTGLNIASSFGYNSLQSKEKRITPITFNKPEDRPNSFRQTSYADNSISSWIIEPQLTYKRALGKRKLDVLIGTTIQQNNNNSQSLATWGYSSDLVMEDIRSATDIVVNSTYQSVYKYNALFGRFNYNLLDKYIVNLTARRDGSSRFGAENLFHNFGAVGAAWLFSEEKAVKNHLSFISFGKFRTSYGTTGNDQIGDYQFLDLYSATTTDIAYQGISGLQTTGLSNPYLQWEETRKLQLGLDLGFFKDRVLINAAYFRNRSSNQLVLYVLPSTTGFSAIDRNFPATVQNTGWELVVNTVNIKNNQFTWNTSLNITIPQNKLVAFPGIENTSYASAYTIGQPITRVKLYHFLGVDPATGVFQFADKEGNATGTLSDPDDKTTIINTSPSFYGGFNNSISYKGFQLDAFFQFVKQKGQNYSLGIQPPGGFWGGSGNQPHYVLDRWQQPGDISENQRYNSNFSLFSQFLNATLNSDAVWAEASYMRLKNISLSWQLPLKWLQEAHFQNARVYVQGQNLLTFTGYKGMDPETRSTTSLPPLKVLTMGIQITL